jgi:flagellar assembly protein FliH
MAAIRKFMFDTEFLDDSLVEETEPAPPPEPTYSQSELDAARAESFADGRKQGLAEAATASDRLAAEALEAIARQLSTLKDAQDSALDAARRDATAIAAAIAAKIAPEIARVAAVDSIVALVAERLPDLMEEPRVVVRLATSQLESVKTRIEETAKDIGFAGKVILLAEDGFEAPDCRIEWADGGTERIAPRVAAEIDRLVARYVMESLN